ncbi:MAG: hypothetical protein GY922_07505 [Proteobacteria bacterium]|nr:hypothetical protein [Pseudomonadota bacterium]
MLLQETVTLSDLWRRFWHLNALVPKAYRLLDEDNASFGQEILDITVAQIAPKVVPDSVANDIRWVAPSRNRLG